MGLGFAAPAADASAYFSTGPVFGQGKWGTATSALPAFIQAMNGRYPPQVYLDSADSIIQMGQRPLGTPGIMRFDPLMLDNGSGGAFYEDSLPNGDVKNGCLIAGEWDRVAGTQTCYFAKATGEIISFDPISMAIIAPDPFVIAAGFTYDEQTNGRAGTDAGLWTNTGIAQGAMVMFESLGYGIKFGSVIRTGALGTTGNPSLADVMHGVALTAGGSRLLGDAVDILDLALQSSEAIDIPIAYVGSPANSFQRPQIFGQDVYFRYGQFVPDSDSTPITPKGFLYLQAQTYQIDAGPPKLLAKPVKVVDWNPTGKSGLPNRIHTRERFISKIEFFAGTILDYEDNFNGLNTKFGSTNDINFIWHPPSNGIRYAVMDQDTLVAPAGGAFDENPRIPGRIIFGKINTVPDIAFVTQPTSLEVRAEVDKTVTYSSHAFGDLGENVQGVNVDFDLAAVSAIAQAVATTDTPNETVVMGTSNGRASPEAQFAPIDDHSYTVYNVGVEIDENTHYDQVDLNAGTMRMIVAYADGDITIDYSYKSRAGLDLDHEAIVTTNPAANETVQVRYFPLKAQSLVVYDVSGPEEVLVEGLDYDLVDLVLGTFRLLDPPASWPNGDIEADYTVARPTTSHGTLLSGSSLSDENGLATTRVRYADDGTLIGAFDDLRAQAETV